MELRSISIEHSNLDSIEQTQLKILVNITKKGEKSTTYFSTTWKIESRFPLWNGLQTVCRMSFFEVL